MFFKQSNLVQHNLAIDHLATCMVGSMHNNYLTRSGKETELSSDLAAAFNGCWEQLF